MLTPFDIDTRNASEHEHQVALFAWCSKAARHGFAAAFDSRCYTDIDYTVDVYGYEGVPALAFIFAIPNGGERHIAVAAKLRAEGVKRGVPDIMLPLRNSTHCGLFIEMKQGGKRKGQVSQYQREFIDFLHQNSYMAVVCYSWAEAANHITDYITGD